MATTTQLRSWFPEPIVSTSPLRCDYSKLVAVRFLAGGATKAHLGRDWIDLRVHPRTQGMWTAVAATFHRWHYSFDEMAGGTAVCRLITSGSGTSIHAHACAGDINPSRNGYRTVVGALDEPDTAHAEGALQWGRYTDMAPGMIREIEGITTTSGHRVVQWGGRWWSIKDPMHFEPDTHPRNLDTGIRLSTVPGWDGYQAWINGEPAPPTQETTMDYTSARLTVARIWVQQTGSLPGGTSTETAQQRLTRIALDIHKGKITTANLFDTLEKFKPADLAARQRAFANRTVPAWVIFPLVPDGTDGTPPTAGSGGITADDARAIAKISVDQHEGLDPAIAHPHVHDTNSTTSKPPRN